MLIDKITVGVGVLEGVATIGCVTAGLVDEVARLVFIGESAIAKERVTGRKEEEALNVETGISIIQVEMVVPNMVTTVTRGDGILIKLDAGPTGVIVTLK